MHFSGNDDNTGAKCQIQIRFDLKSPVFGADSLGNEL